jgi:hypothetical protein
MQTPYPLAIRMAHPNRLTLAGYLLTLLALLLPGAAGAQAPAWAAATPSSITQAGGNSVIRAMATDASGNVFATGWFSGKVAFGSTVLISQGSNDLFVAKYVPATDTWAWAQSGGGTGVDIGNGIAVSGSSVYVTGVITNTTSNTNQVLFGGTGTTPGTVQVNGATASLNATDLVVAKYTDNGSTATLGWTQVGGGTGSDTGAGIAVNGTNVYVTGTIFNSAANNSGVLFGGTGTTPGTVQVNGASSNLFNSDLVVAKYTDNGSTATLGWTQVGGGSNNDTGVGIAVSGTNVYVTGNITNTTANTNQVLFGGAGTTPGTVQVNGTSTSLNASDLVVAKYTDNGSTATLGWTQVGGGAGNDTGAGIAVNGTNVYVTGTIFNSTANNSGVLFGGTGTTPGTVQVNGASAVSSRDLVVAKYTDNGPTATLAWTQVGGGAGSDTGAGIAARGTNVYVTGSITNNTVNNSGVLFGGTGTTPGTGQVNGVSGISSQDLVVAKYTDNGSTATLGWTQVGGGTSSDTGAGIAVSGSSVVVGGEVTPSPNYTFAPASTSGLRGTMGNRAVVALADAGTGTWQGLATSFNGGSSEVQAVATDARGNVFVTGSFTGQVTFGNTMLTSRGWYDLFVAKYVPATDTWAWAQSGGGTGNAGDFGAGIAVSGNSVYVTGSITNDTGNTDQVLFGGTDATPGTVQVNGASGVSSQDLLVAKYTDNGSTATLAWTQVGGGTTGDAGSGIAVSGSSVYVTGAIVNTTTNAYRVLFGGTGTTPGTVPVNGANSIASGQGDLVVAKYTDNGSTATLAWTQVGGGADRDYGAAIAVSGSTVYVTGAIVNTTANSSGVLFGGTGTAPGTVPVNGTSGTSSQDLVVAKYTDNGSTATLGWTQVGGGVSTDTGAGIAVSGTNVYVTGQIQNNASNANGVLFGGTGTTPGTVQVNGTTSGVSNYDLVVAKYTDNGSTATLGWTQVGGGSGFDEGYDIAVSGSSVYVTGIIINNTGNSSGVLFGGTGTTPGTVPVNGASAVSSRDLVVAKYTDNGPTATLNWTQIGGGTRDDAGYGVAVSGQNVLVGGYVSPSASFGSFTIANPTGTVTGALYAATSVLARLVDTNLAPLAVSQKGGTARLTLWPNPANHGVATLTGTQPGTIVRVFDALGRPVVEATADATGNSILAFPLGLASGVYVVRAGTSALRLVVE